MGENWGDRGFNSEEANLGLEPWCQGALVYQEGVWGGLLTGNEAEEHSEVT